MNRYWFPIVGTRTLFLQLPNSYLIVGHLRLNHVLTRDKPSNLHLLRKTMASNTDGTDETAELFHILNGTDDEIKTFTELKPVRLSFQAERFVSTQDIYYDDQSYMYNHVDHNNEPTETSDWTNNGSNRPQQT